MSWVEERLPKERENNSVSNFIALVAPASGR